MSLDIDNLVVLLNSNLEDPDNTLFGSSSFKIAKLDEAKISLCNLLDVHYLTEITNIESNVSVIGAGYVPFSALTGEVAGGDGGILTAQIYGGSWINLIELNELGKLNNTFAKSSTRNPMGYILQARIYVLPATINNINISYLKMPDTLVSGGTSILNISLKELMINIAESKCRIAKNDIERGTTILSIAYDEIKVMNNKYLKRK